MKEHGIPFSPAMLAALDSGTKSETRRLQPRSIKKGDRIWVKEALHPMKALLGPGVQVVVYSYDRQPVFDDTTGLVIPWPWKVARLTAMYMPKWAARTWLIVKEVRIEPLYFINDEEAQHEGFHTVSEFRADWNLLHPRIPFSDDPLVQVIVFKVEEKGS